VSAPDPRFTTSSLTGYPMETPNYERTTWYVFDRLNCHRVVANFDGRDAHDRALAFVAKLNDCPDLLQDLLAGTASLLPRRRSGLKIEQGI
jgi:hypothetical protein